MFINNISGSVVRIINKKFVAESHLMIFISNGHE